MMKHRELIISAMDGKTIQYRLRKGPWYTINTPSGAINLLLMYPDIYDYRIEPAPVQDKVFYGVVCNDHISESEVRDWMNHSRRDSKPIYTNMVKLTIKTDDNGVETKTVELV